VEGGFSVRRNVRTADANVQANQAAEQMVRGAISECIAVDVQHLLQERSAGGLCRTCTWGTVRVGFFNGETETLCRLVGPQMRVRFTVRDCTDYCDRRVPMTATGERRYGFVTEIKLEPGEIRVTADEEKEPTTK
jgi:hypothetical protein